jgi:hypothetical protein
MSWHFSQALVEEYLAATSSDGAPFAPSNGNPTPQAYCSPDRMTACSRLSRFGMTFAPLTDDHGADLLTWYRAAFPARTSAPPEKAQESTASAADSGVKWRESSVKYDPATSSWKTHLCLWEEALPWSSVTLPRWGMTVNGVVYQHPTQERPISGTGSGLWPTPTQDSATERTSKYAQGGTPLTMAVKMWQTPVADDSCNRPNGKWNSRGEPKLSAQVKLYPTPCARDYFPPHTPEYIAKKKAQGHGMSNLNDYVAKWPTPTVNDSKNSTLPPSQINHDNIPGALIRNGEAPGGQLNPTWVEWLMGWPLGWTDLKPLEMDKFREWQQQHGGF